MPTNKTKHDAAVLAFLVIITLAGIAFFIVKLWLPEKNESKNDNSVEENAEDQLNIPEINVDELKWSITAGEELIILDVQSRDDNIKASLPQAISIPLDELNARITELPKNKTIIAIDSGESCESCSRAAEILLTSGYTDVKKLDGGVTAWAEAGYPIMTGNDITVKNINAKELNDKLTIYDDIVVLDVREKEEYEAGHIKNAKHIPFAGVAKNLQDIPRDKEIIVYDQAGNRSQIVVKQLIKEGYLDTINLLDGFVEWQREGYEVEK
ncbi:MAG: rhodanese-like domain-containing protein [Parcubacteria group bacterium]